MSPFRAKRITVLGKFVMAGRVETGYATRPAHRGPGRDWVRFGGAAAGSGETCRHPDHAFPSGWMVVPGLPQKADLWDNDADKLLTG
jgi:hypothetical protein